MADYVLLRSEDRVSVLEHLANAHSYFYHFTPWNNLGGIKQVGLDPRCESDDSWYADKKLWEPGPAMRYCSSAEDSLKIGLGTAKARARNTETFAAGRVSLLRTKASSLLKRRFGLDHSNSCVMEAVRKVLHPESELGHLKPGEFTKLIQQFGISSYDCIPPRELEISTAQDVTCRSAFNGFIELIDFHF